MIDSTSSSSAETTAAGTGCMAALDAEKYLAAQEYEAIAAE